MPPINAKVVIRIARVPETHFGQPAPRNRRSDRIGGIGIKLRLKQRGADQPGDAHHRHMRGDDQIIAVDFQAVALNSQRIGFDLFDLAFSRKSRCRPMHGFRQTGQVGHRMKLCLVRKLDAPGDSPAAAASTNRASNPSFRAKFASLSNCFASPLFAVQRSMQEPGHPTEFAAHLCSSAIASIASIGDVRRLARKPGLLFAECFRELRQPDIGDVGQMSRGAGGVAGANMAALQQADSLAGLFEKVGRRKARDPAADHDNVEVHRFF